MNLPEDIVNHICCLAAKMREPSPVVEDLKTLWMLDGVIMEYLKRYKSNGMMYLGFDIDEQFPEYDMNYGAVKKWMLMSVKQRKEFCDRGMKGRRDWNQIFEDV